jgi:hypothetical protein
MPINDDDVIQIAADVAALRFLVTELLAARFESFPDPAAEAAAFYDRTADQPRFLDGHPPSPAEDLLLERARETVRRVAQDAHLLVARARGRSRPG